MRKLLAVFGMACLLAGCAVYPNGAIGPAPLVVAPTPYYGGGYGYARPYAYGYGARGYGYGGGYGGYRRW
jgi:hypothetical protein